MVLSYDIVFEDFLGSVNDYQIASLEEDDAYTILAEYLHKAVKSTYVRRLFATFKLDDDAHTITYEFKNIVSEQEDEDFLIDILSKGMIIAWLEPQVNKASLTHQMITSSKEGNWFSQASHLSELKDLYSTSKTAMKKAIVDRGYIYNPYLSEEET